MRKKRVTKAQVTVFMILGILILGLVGLFSYMSSSILNNRDIPQEFLPVTEYIDQCIVDITGDGVFLASMQGGYITLPQEIINNDEAHIDMGFKVPLWYYKGKQVGPPIEQVEEDLAEYIQEQLPYCLNNFEPFQNQFTITGTTENISAQTTITMHEIDVEINLPITLTKEEKQFTIPTLTTETDYNLGQMLELAYSIMNLEDSQYFLEHYTNEIIASSDYLPYDGLEFTCQPRIWDIENDMKPYIKNIIEHNIKYIMFENTDYEETGIPYYDNLYTVKTSNQDFSNLKVNTMYNQEWGLTLDVQPNERGTVRDLKVLGNTLYIPCTKLYHHKYTVEYPVLFQIVDNEFPEIPFYLATPVIMRRNEPNRFSEVQPWPVEKDTIASRQYCSEETYITLYQLDSEGNIQTQPSTTLNRFFTLEVFAYDSLYGLDLPLTGVNISYRCGAFECDIGQTKYNIVALPSLKTKFPTCLNGRVIASKEGYQDAEVVVSVDETTDMNSVNVEMVRKIPVDVELIVVQDHNGIVTHRSTEPEENALITITNEDEDIQEYIIINENGTTEKLELLAKDITYQLNIQLTTEESYLGSFELNWTPSVSDMINFNKVRMFVIKKDILSPSFILSDEDYKEMLEYAKQHSEYYPPEFIY